MPARGRSDSKIAAREDVAAVTRPEDGLLIRGGTRRRFKNAGRQRAVTFNVYSPPEYQLGMKG
jgi:hypothetical protein